MTKFDVSVYILLIIGSLVSTFIGVPNDMIILMLITIGLNIAYDTFKKKDNGTA